VFEGLRALTAGRAVPTADLAWAALLSAGYLVLAGALFARVFGHARRTGLLARYSAETVG
jgi:ABC-2 type transport system permease protein